MRRPFCQAECSAEERARRPDRDMREERARSKPEAISAETSDRGKIRRNPLGYFWSAFSKYASIRGRACRTEYVCFMIGAFACWIGIAYGVGALLKNSARCARLFDAIVLTTNVSEPALTPGAILGAVLFVPPILSLCARRLHDVGLSGWHVVVLFSIQSIVKSLGLDLFASFVPLFLLFWPGTRGENAYGSDPRFETSTEPKKP